MSTARRSALLVSVLGALCFAATASAETTKSYTLPEASIGIVVGKDGTIRMAEQITYSFSGSFSGGYREIPLRAGESITNVSVSSEGTRYVPGGCTELGCIDSPDTYGVAHLDGRDRIVWHSSAFNENKTFLVQYTLHGLAVAYSDVVDVNLQVWGSEWKVSLGRLTARITAPGKIVRGWGGPVYVRGDVTLKGNQANLRALSVPSKQFVGLRVLIPRRAFTSTASMKVVDGKGLAKIIAEQKNGAATLEKEHAGIEHAKHHLGRYLLYIVSIAILPALAVLALVFWFFGREYRTGYDREYEQEPPTDTAPALVPTLLRQGGEAGSLEFTATLFDLIRRGVYTSTPATTEKSVWGGMKKETVADLEISAGKTDVELTPWERAVADVVDGVLGGGTARLSEFRDKITANRTTMSTHFTSFKNTASGEVKRLGWLRSPGALPLGLGVLTFGGAGVILIGLGAKDWRAAYPRWSDVVLIALGIAAIVNAVIVGLGFTQRPLWRRRTKEANLESQR